MIASQPSPDPIHDMIRRAYSLMRSRFGHQNWWPAKSTFEVCIGAILTQNTSWKNVERALHQLRQRDLLCPHRLAAVTDTELVELLRPAGCSRVKTRRLRSFLNYLQDKCDGDPNNLWHDSTQVTRDRLLSIHGIGPETADSILLYAADRPVFVVDAYTMRIFTRHAWCPSNPGYDLLQQLAQTALHNVPPTEQLDLFQDYHAQLVMAGKQYCRSRAPRCQDCPLQPLLPAHTPPHPAA